MTWSDVPSIIFAAFVAISLGFCLYAIGVTLAAKIWPRRFNVFPDVETPLGRFAWFGDVWIANSVGEDFVQVYARNRDGAPAPAFIEVVPDILAALADFERLAREFEPLLGSLGYELSAIRQGEGDHEWGLLFNEYDEELAERAVDFADGRPIRSYID